VSTHVRQTKRRLSGSGLKGRDFTVFGPGGEKEYAETLAILIRDGRGYGLRGIDSLKRANLFNYSGLIKGEGRGPLDSHALNGGQYALHHEEGAEEANC